MKRIPDKEQRYEQLDVVTFSQAQKLKDLGFDWDCGFAYNIAGEEVDWNAHDFYCWRPTVQLALRFMRKRHGVYHTVYVRSWDENLFGFGISHSIASIDIIDSDLSEQTDEQEDGITSFDYDEAESIALDYAIRDTLKNYSRDFSFIKKNTKVYMCNYNSSGKFAHLLKVLSVNQGRRVAQVCEVDLNDDEYEVQFKVLYQTPEEALKHE